MSRTFTIYSGPGSRQCTDDDLPLRIGGSEESHIFLDSGADTQGFIGDFRGHLFLQPASRSIQVFHNDREIKESVWIKSGDITRLDRHLIHYGISGDRVEIRVSSAAQETAAAPETPSSFSGKHGEDLPDISVREKENKRRYRVRLFRASGLVFVLLLAAAFFVLAAKSLEIQVEPQPDSLTVAGFPPVIRIGERFLGLRGQYVLKAEKEGFRPLETPVSISRESTANSYAFTLEKLPGRVSFFSQPQEAEVFVNGKSLGKTPLHNLEVPEGSHALRIIRDRFEDVVQNIVVEGLGHRQRFDFSLAPAWSTVLLTSEPAGAEVILDGRARGTTPLSLDLLKGEHRIIFQKEKFSPLQTELTVPAGENLSPAPAVLIPQPATLELTSTPPGASVLVDSIFHGQTPAVIELASRQEHTLSLSLPGYESLNQKILPNPGEQIKLSPALTPEYGTVFLTTEPPDADLFIDGQPHGKATGRIELAVRQHSLELQAAGYKTLTMNVLPVKGYSRHLELRLEPEQSGNISPAQQQRATAGGGQEMILLPPAVFAMGSSGREPGRRANEHLHQVRITRPYYLSAREVTNGEFRRFKPGHSSGLVAGFSLDGDRQPAVNVSWEDAARYLNWLSGQDGLDPFYREENGSFVPVQPPTDGYRLPFEAEWAYAARYAGNPKPPRYPWSGSFPPPGKSGNFADESARTILPIIIRGYDDSFPVTAPVASFPADRSGFFDIGGNVSEWCHDFYTPYISLSTGIVEDPTGPETGVHHVIRGASWRDGSITELRLTYRSYSNQALDDTGFRIARFAR